MDLACGTGLVTFLFAKTLQADGKVPIEARVVAVDISSGMLDIARSKLHLDENTKLGIKFIEHDITSLDSIVDGEFDIITCCSALVLLPDPRKAIAHWAKYLKRGGKMVIDIPHGKSMLGLKCLSLVAESFGVEMLGNRNWIVGLDSLKVLMESAGLQSEVLETEIFEDIPSRTEEGRSEWGAEQGGMIFEKMVKGTGRLFNGIETLGTEDRSLAKGMFEDEWRKLAGTNGKVREEGRLWVGIGQRL